MKKYKDPRINIRFVSIKEYIILFISLAAFNGFHMWILEYFRSRGMVETNVQAVINILIAYVLIVAVVITGIIAFIRHALWSRPMYELGEAARKIAKGDFSIRLFPLRNDQKKGYIDVMFDDFNTMAQELQSIETLKTDFIANVSHEIKTPLSVIQSYAEALQDDNLNSDERHEYSKTIVEATQKLSTLVSNILKLNKLENQEILQEAPPFNLGEQIRNCTLAFEELWENKNISLNVELEEIMIGYDKNMLELVWNNLLSNAIKFTNPHGSIFIQLKAQGGYAHVSINDTGCGIDAETQKRIFDKFYQGDTSHAQEGNGLGLALVKRIIVLLGGTIAVESKPEQGAAFTVCLKI